MKSFALNGLCVSEKELQNERAEDGYETFSSYRGIWPCDGGAGNTGRPDFRASWPAASHARGCGRATESASCVGSWLLPVSRRTVRVGARLLGDSAPASRGMGAGSLDSAAWRVCLGKRFLAVGWRRLGEPATRSPVVPGRSLRDSPDQVRPAAWRDRTGSGSLRSLRGTDDKIVGGTGALTPRQSQISQASRWAGSNRE